MPRRVRWRSAVVLTASVNAGHLQKLLLFPSAKTTGHCAPAALGFPTPRQNIIFVFPAASPAALGFAAVPRGIQEGYHCFFAGAAESDVPASAPAAASLTGEAAKEMPDRFNLPPASFSFACLQSRPLITSVQWRSFLIIP